MLRYFRGLDSGASARELGVPAGMVRWRLSKARLMAEDTAGDPMTGLRWTHKTTRKIRRARQAAKTFVSRTTVARLLKQCGYSLRVNRKLIAMVKCPHRDRQFQYIKRLRRAFTRDALRASARCASTVGRAQEAELLDGHDLDVNTAPQRRRAHAASAP